MNLAFTVAVQILKPIDEVFDAVYNPKKLKEYFTTAGASAPMDANTTVMREFADYPGAFPVYVKTCILNEQITFEREAADGGYNTTVVFEFIKKGDGVTTVKISESWRKESEKNLAQSYNQCQGRTQMSCCLKAYLEYGINLRKGFFDPTDIWL